MLRGRALNQCPHGHKEQDLAPAIHGDFDLRFLGLSHCHTSNMARAMIEPLIHLALFLIFPRTLELANIVPHDCTLAQGQQAIA